MSQVYVIEHADEPVGLIQRTGGDAAFIFFASDRRCVALDGRRFATPYAAEAAVALHLSGAGLNLEGILFGLKNDCGRPQSRDAASPRRISPEGKPAVHGQGLP